MKRGAVLELRICLKVNGGWLRGFPGDPACVVLVQVY